MFPQLPANLNLTLMEEDVLRFWRRERISEKVSSQQAGRPEYTFYERLQRANSAPGIHPVLERLYIDLFLRYKTMRGFHVARHGGWDTHGLPIEIEIEKRLGINSKSQIEAFGVARFNQLCRKSAFDYVQDWERLADRIGYWTDAESAYVTFTKDYIESLWGILKAFWEKGLLYQAEKAVPYCPRCGTPLSHREVAHGYKQIETPSLYVRLPLVDEPGASLLVWTAAPWTLIENLAVAAHPEVEYVKVERPLPEGGAEQLILAGPLLPTVFPGEKIKVVERFKGRRLKGRKYRPLFTFQLPEKPAYFIVLEQFVNTENGTGLVPIAPSFSAEALQAAQKHNLPRLNTVGADGAFLPEIRPFSGKFVKEAEPHIVQDLEARGLLLRSVRIKRNTPFCCYCDTQLIPFARPAWFLGIAQVKERMIANSQAIQWVPADLLERRFRSLLENGADWAVGRERYWGAPLPVWECDHCRRRLFIGSVSELEQLSGRSLSSLDLHRPSLDEVYFPCPDCSPATGARMQRLPHVLDAALDAGAMPVIQGQSSPENAEAVAEQFPADLVCAPLDQMSGWFHALHSLGSLVFDQPAYRNAVGLGPVLDTSSGKISKSRGNWIDPSLSVNKYGADAFRWHLYAASPLARGRRLSAESLDSGARQAVRGFTLKLWNVFSFFVAYANLAGWNPDLSSHHAAGEVHILDRWLLSELQVLIQQVTGSLEAFDVITATRRICSFVDDLSGWYLRCSRRRFSASAPEQERQSAFAALYETLVTLSKLLAPAMPFLAEELYQRLSRPDGADGPSSVHLVDWPEPDVAKIDPSLDVEMRLVMKLASLGLAARQRARIPLRQPLEEVAFSLGNLKNEKLLEKYASLLSEQLNVRRVRRLGSSGDVVTYRLKPLPQQLGSKYKRLYPRLNSAILALDTEGAARALLAGHNLLVAVDGKPYHILPEDVDVSIAAPGGYASAAQGAYLAAVKPDLTPKLKEAGLVAELIHRLQGMRKRADLRVGDRIRVYLHASPHLWKIMDTRQAEIMERTRAVSLEELPGSELPEAHRFDFKLDGEQVTAAIAVSIE